MAEDTDIVEASLVFVGSFNPAIFSPAWFRLHDLITDGQLEAAELNVVHPQVAQFSIEHLRITAETEKLVINVTTDPVVRIADMAVRILRDLLPHVPVRALGINYGEHWRVDRWERRLALGRALAPLEPWGEWGSSFCSNDKDLVAGLINLSLQQPFRDGTSGHRRVTVEPSAQVTDKYRGIHVAFNHHVDLSEKGENGAQQACDLIEEKFDSVIAFAKQQIEQLRRFADGLEIE